MKSPMLKELYRTLPLLISFAGAIASVMAFLIYFRYQDGQLTDRLLGYASGILGGVIGAAMVFVVSRVKRAMSAPAVFISYSSDQAGLAKRIAEKLEELPVRVLYDQHELQVGDSIGVRLAELVDESDYLVFIVSEGGMKSHWVRKELELALAKNKRLLPVLAEKVELPDELRNLVFADFTGTFEDGFARLRSALESKATRVRSSV
jgi:TIR domain